MTARSVDFLHPRRAPWTGWLLLALGAATAAAAVWHDREIDTAQAARELAQAKRQDEEAQARRRAQQALTPTVDSIRELGARSELQRPWMATFRALEAATADPVFVLALNIDPGKGSVHVDAVAPTLDDALVYVERLGQEHALADVHLTSHDVQNDLSTGRSSAHFSVGAKWVATP